MWRAAGSTFARAAMLGVVYFDRWVKATAAEAQFKVAFNRGSRRQGPGLADGGRCVFRSDPARPRQPKAYRHRLAYLHLGTTTAPSTT